MAAYKKKIVVFLAAAALSSGAMTVWAVEPPADEPTKPLFPDSYRLPDNDANVSVGSAGHLSTRELFFKMMLAVLLVAVLGAAAIYISKKFGARIANLPGKRIHIIETTHLGQRKTVHLLKVGNQQLLIGSTSDSITKLADVTAALSETDLSVTETDNN